MPFYRKPLTDRARILRRDMTDAERQLWAGLKQASPEGVRFRRQVPIGRYIVDFACLSLRLVVEVDGGQHYSDAGMARDAVRDAWLRAEGFRILRVSNHDVLTNLEGVVIAIISGIQPVPPPQPLPTRGRG
ncbi:endonuclease domain-containing protein [Kaistia adipata]|uniref:endonuclease domain-containing protein n=1 Tax=Kaistia adipata TaxID=166954 RepID=UPI0003FA34E7|nr:endonuclease domain-containing protein [Kaistia adipata]